MVQINYNRAMDIEPIEKYYTGTDTLKAGYALCHNPDADSDRLNFDVEQPDSGNLQHFAGVVHPNDHGRDGPCTVKIIPPVGTCDAFTNRDASAGDVLGLLPGSYNLVPVPKDGVAKVLEDVTYATDSDSGRVRVALSLNAQPDLLPHRYFNDFDGDYISGEWTVTNTDGDADSGETNDVTDEQGGVLVLTTNDAEDDAEQHVLANETFKLQTGKALMAEFRCSLDAATESDMSIGLAVTEDLSGGTLIPNDGVVFKKDDGDTHIDLAAAKDGTDDTTTEVGTMDTDYHRYGIHWDGCDTITFLIDGAVVGTCTAAASIVDDELIAPHLMVLAGSAAKRTLKTDYIDVAQAR